MLPFLQWQVPTLQRTLQIEWTGSVPSRLIKGQHLMLGVSLVWHRTLSSVHVTYTFLT